MKKLLTLVSFLVFLFFTINSAFCATVVFKNGKVRNGDIIQRTDNYIKLHFDGMTIRYPLTDISYIDDEAISIKTEDPLVIKPKIDEVPIQTHKSEEPEPERVKTSSEITVDMSDFEDFSSLDNFHHEESPVSDVLAGGVFIGLLVFVIALVAFYCYCLQIIAKRTGTENGWFAWIPILNMLLMLDIAKRPRWWILLWIFVGLIPIIGQIVTIVTMAIVWIEISAARGKSYWVGILAVFPVTSMFVLPYLAFSK